MFTNYVKVAIRNLFKYKTTSFINIFGFSIGIACCLLLSLWIQDELSFDRFHNKKGQIYRVISQIGIQNNKKPTAKSPAPLGPALSNEFPWIEKNVRITEKKFLVECNNKIFYEDIFFADPEIFSVFDFDLAIGDSKNVLKEPYTIIISEEIRKKYFGDENPIGKTINLEKWKNFTIVGVLKKIPRNSHLRFGFLSSVQFYRPDYHSKWGVYNYYTYILVSKISPINTFNERMPFFVDKYIGKEKREQYGITFRLQPLSDIHLNSNCRNDVETNSDIVNVYIFSAIAIFILMLACFNYINISTARFNNRAKEIGLRKVFGASNLHLIKQFILESVIFALISFPISIILAILFLPTLNSLSEKTLSFNYFNNVILFTSAIGTIIIVGLISGLAPIFSILKFKSINTSGKIFKKVSSFSMPRKILVFFQYTISTIFILISLVIYCQLHYIKKKDLTIDIKNVVNVHINHNEQALLKYKNIKNEFLQIPHVLAVSASAFYPGYPRWNMNYWHEGVNQNESRIISCIPIDQDFFNIFKIKFIEGRGFSENFPTDENAFIINETALKEFGWDSAIDKNFNLADWKKGKIIGVVQDFNFNSLRDVIQPVVFYIEPSNFEYFHIRINSTDIAGTLDLLQKKWSQLVKNQPFIYSFLDDDFDLLYKSEIRLEKIFIIATILAVSIASLGLFGFTLCIVEQRTKEIGIRKALGASIGRIVLLFTKDFSKLIILSNLFSWPFAFYIMNKWLESFVYRVKISPYIFVLTGLSTLIFAILTIIFKIYKAAKVNTIEIIRYE